jgi:hypothetical protein
VGSVGVSLQRAFVSLKAPWHPQWAAHEGEAHASIPEASIIMKMACLIPSARVTEYSPVWAIGVVLDLDRVAGKCWRWPL